MLAVVFLILIILILFGWYIPNNNYRDRETIDALPDEGPTRLHDFEDFTSSDGKYLSKPQNSVTLGKTVVLEDRTIPSDWWLCLNMDNRLDGIYCFGYRIGMSMDDEWTVRINKFKHGTEHDVKKAVKTLKTAAPSLFECIGIDPETTTVIPVLGSQETSANENSKITRLARAIAEGADARFMWDCLSKKYKTLSFHLQRLGRRAREQALDKAEFRASELDDRCKNVMIVDDIVTTGLTMVYVANAIHQSNPLVKIVGFALGRHKPKDYLAVSFDEANSEIPDELAEIWDQA